MSVTTTINKTRAQGDDYDMNFVYKEDGVAADITSCTFSLKIEETDGTALSTTAGSIVVAGSGTFKFSFTTEFDLDVGTYNYEVLMVNAAGKELTVVQGELEITERYHAY